MFCNELANLGLKLKSEFLFNHESDFVYDFDFEHYGIRIQVEDTNVLGSIMNWESQIYDNGEPTGEYLDGVCALDLNDVWWANHYNAYYGNVIYLLGCNDISWGDDDGEIIMRKPTVLAKMIIG